MSGIPNKPTNRQQNVRDGMLLCGLIRPELLNLLHRLRLTLNNTERSREIKYNNMYVYIIQR